MDKSFYEQLLEKNHRGGGAAEAAWDARAKHFSQSQQTDRSGLAEKVTAILKEKDILTGAEVLDIGGGSGRYAIPFAVRAEQVTVTDISGNMLEMAKENAQKAGLTNLEYIKLDWAEADLAALGWEKRFNLAFASMCPAIRCAEGLRKMIAASKGFCLIDQFIYTEDSLASYLTNELGVQKTYDPHNDRDTVQAVFNLLWLDGYEPEVTYLRQHVEDIYAAEEATERYAGKYAQIALQHGMDLSALIAGYAVQKSLKINSETTLAMILWKV